MEENTNHIILTNSNKTSHIAMRAQELSPDSSYEAIEQLMTWVLDNKDQESSNVIWNDVTGPIMVKSEFDSRNIDKLQKTNFKYRRNRLFHKFIRIKKELDFINKNIKNFRAITPREKEVIRLLANGNNNSEIAEQLFISRFTVEQHRKNINRKLKIKSFPHLILYSYAFDLV